MMQVQVDPSEDTEWNAILREKGILPPLPKPTEESPGPSPETKRREAAERLSYDKLTARIESLEDTGQDEDETKFLEEYRQKRMAEMRQAAARAKFGSVREVTKTDWVNEINQAGKGVYVVVHITRQGNEKCSVVDMHLRTLAARYPDVKFVRGEVTSCIPDLPDSNLPTLIVYYEGEVRVRLVGSKALGGHPVSIEALEDRLANASVIKPPERTEKSSKKPTLIRGRSSSSEDSD
uniref:Phosducin-like protein 3 n=1 Tax=Schistocephalus solidus TaxID=70667 RepID=A0A0X3Q6K0_SCHSO